MPSLLICSIASIARFAPAFVPANLPFGGETPELPLHRVDPGEIDRNRAMLPSMGDILKLIWWIVFTRSARVSLQGSPPETVTAE
jgi:hypothetical protein